MRRGEDKVGSGEKIGKRKGKGRRSMGRKMEEEGKGKWEEKER